MTKDHIYNSRLVDSVKKNPCLYNYNLKEYSNRDAVNVAWEHVAKEMGDTVRGCKETWRHLRIAFARNSKKLSSGTRKKKYYLSEKMQFLKPYLNNVIKKSFSENSPTPVKCEPEDELSESHSIYLIEEKLQDEFNQNIEYEVLNLHPQDKEICQFTETGKSMQTTRNGQEIDRRENPVEKFKDPVVNYIESNEERKQENYRRQFLLSLLPDVEEMNPSQFRQFRKQVGNLIDDIL